MRKVQHAGCHLFDDGASCMGVTKAIFRVLVRKEEVAVGSGLSQGLKS